jgi:hypothetical protein
MIMIRDNYSDRSRKISEEIQRRYENLDALYIAGKISMGLQAYLKKLVVIDHLTREAAILIESEQASVAMRHLEQSQRMAEGINILFSAGILPPHYKNLAQLAEEHHRQGMEHVNQTIQSWRTSR